MSQQQDARQADGQRRDTEAPAQQRPAHASRGEPIALAAVLGHLAQRAPAQSFDHAGRQPHRQQDQPPGIERLALGFRLGRQAQPEPQAAREQGPDHPPQGTHIGHGGDLRRQAELPRGAPAGEDHGGQAA
ncbi:hypothetical protein KCV01_g2200, partial [Aureobasidium melanogenum]